MSSTLSAERLFDRALPPTYARALEGLAELDALTRAPVGTRDSRREPALRICAGLLGEAAALVEPTPAQLGVGTAEHRRWFTEAVLLWTRLGETSSPPLIDTVGSQRPAGFPLDLPVEGEGVARIRSAVREGFGWSALELASVELHVDHMTSNLPVKRAVAAALAAELSCSERLSPAGRVELMQAFYGPVPWRPGDVDLLMTSTALFFCVPVQGEALCVPDWPTRSEEERARIAAFLVRLSEANKAETLRFPAFGHFDPAAVDAALADALCDAVLARMDPKIARHVGRRVILETLATMVTVLPTQLVDQFLVHDAWGHTWQEALAEFEWEYAALRRIDEPLGPLTGPEFGRPGSPALRDAFVARGGRTELDEEVLLAAAEADLRGRIRLATSMALSEILADFMEAKYVRLLGESCLPTSSLLPATELRLDLTLTDVNRQVARWSGPWRRLLADGAARGALAAALLADGRPEAGLAEAVSRASRLMWDALAPAFDLGLGPEPAQGEAPGLRSSVLRRLLLQVLLITAELHRVLDGAAASSESAWLDPGRCPDLYAIATAHFYEQDRQTNFWLLDHVLRTELPRACEGMRSLLRGETS